MKKVLIILVGCLVSFSTIAQQNLYKWRVGIHGGLGTYYGDLSTGRFLDPQTKTLRFWDNPKNLSYGLNLEYSMTNAWGFRLMATRGSFEANDRATKWNGDPYLESDQYSRALNFRTSYHDLDAMFLYHFDNGRFFGEKSFFAPYIGIGIGYMNFNVKGDLYQENGRQYHYWSDNTVRDISESSPNAANANIIEQDGDYETDLSLLQAEGADYSTSTLSFPLAMGLKFRLNDRINLNLETLLHYSMSDYLDDVSGEYPSVFDSNEQLYASNPSGVVRDTRGNSNKMSDIYGSFNLSIGYNFGYKKQSFKAPVFYLGESDPVAPIVIPEPEISNTNTTTTTTMTTTTITEDNDSIIVNVIDAGETKTIIVDAENIDINDEDNPITIIRDTVYQEGKVIHEKVIIRTDTVREIIREEIYIDDNSSGYVVPFNEETEELSLIPITTELDTIITLDPITMKEDVVVYAGEIAVEEVPEEPVFTLEAIETIELESIDHEYFYENIGYLKDDLSEEEVVLSEIQESNFELIALRNEINELKIKDNKSQEDIDLLYQKLDELGTEQVKIEQYQESITTDANDENQAAKIELQQASQELADDIAEVRTEIIYLEAPASSNSQLEYERIRAENNKRISSLEKEMRKLRKDIRKSQREDLPPRVHNPSRSEDKEKEKEKETVVVQTPTPTPSTIIVENSNPAADLEYQLKISNLQKELERVKSNSAQTAAAKDLELLELKKELMLLEAKMNAAQTASNTDSKTLEYISALEGKLNQLNNQLSNTQKDIEALKNRPTPKASTTTIVTRPEPRPRPQSQIVSVISPAKEAINRLGVVSIYYNTGKSDIKPEFYNNLNRIVSLMKQYPEITVSLTGFTDKSGNPDANFRLSKKRSDAVANYLGTRGISSSRIRSNYYGDTQSSSNNDPFSRRVEIIMNTY